MRTIGIKLADGSFYPVMEEGSAQKKTLELTTAHNNQTCVMVDLYRSKTCSMDDAEYIDTLKIENLNEHPNGEPSIAFDVDLDENGELSYSIADPETGTTSNSEITLVSRTVEERLQADDYSIEESPAVEEPVEESAEEPAGDESSGNGAAVAAGVVAGAGLMAAAAALASNKDDDATVAEEASYTEDTLPDFEDTTITEPEADETFAKEAPVTEDETIAADEETFAEEAPVVEDETITADEETFVEDEPVADDDANQTEDFSIPDGLTENPDFSDASGFADTGAKDPLFSEDLDDMDFNSEPAVTEQETFETEPEPVTEEETFDSESETTDETFGTESEPSDETIVSDSEPSDETVVSDSEPADDTFAEDTDFSDEIFDTVPETSDDTFDTVPETSDETFDTEPQPSDETFFDEQEPVPASSSGMDFSGLYDKETEMGAASENQDDDFKKKTRAPVIICIVCAIICLVATALILLVLPTKFNLRMKHSQKKQEVAVEKTVETTATPAPEKAPEPEPVPQAKEDEVVVIEKAEEVKPVPPPAAETKPAGVTYKIKWGDTLWDLADTYYKNPWRYKKIANYNNIKNPDHIISGTVITIPAE